MLDATIAAAFGGFLDRKVPPRQVADKPDLAAAAAEVLLHAIRINAPPGAGTDWWRRVEMRLELGAMTQSWPIASEVAEACMTVNAETMAAVPVAASDHPPGIEALARRMASGQPVGEGDLYGVQAVALLRSGLIAPEVLDWYRDGAFFNRAGLYGREAAERWQAERRAHHERVAMGCDQYRV